MKNKKILIIIVVLAVVLAGAGAAVYMFVLKPGSDTEAEAPLYTYALEDSFVTNVKDSNKLFKATITLVINDEKGQKTLEDNATEVRDTILFALRGLTEDEISDTAVQDTLRTELAQDVNDRLGIDFVVSVYFSDFVMQ